MALAECGTHAIVAAEPGTCDDNKHGLATRLVANSGALEPGVLLLADRGLYSYALLIAVLATGADVCFRVAVSSDLPVLEWLPDGSYLSYVPDPDARRRAWRRLKNQKVAITDLPGIHVRVVDYEVPGRGGIAELAFIEMIGEST